MHKASLLAYRVRKAGRSVRLGFRNPKPSPGDGGSAKALLLGSKESSFVANGPSTLVAHGSSEARNAPITLLSESLLSKGKQATAAPEVPTPTSALHRGQAPSTQATSARSDGEASEDASNGHFRRASIERPQRKVQRKHPGLQATPPIFRFFPKILLLFPAFLSCSR
jgi:hypothetical protein